MRNSSTGYRFLRFLFSFASQDFLASQRRERGALAAEASAIMYCARVDVKPIKAHHRLSINRSGHAIYMVLGVSNVSV